MKPVDDDVSDPELPPLPPVLAVVVACWLPLDVEDLPPLDVELDRPFVLQAPVSVAVPIAMTSKPRPQREDRPIRLDYGIGCDPAT